MEKSKKKIGSGNRKKIVEVILKLFGNLLVNETKLYLMIMTLILRANVL